MQIRRLEPEDYKQYLPLINDFRETQLSEAEFTGILDYIRRCGAIWVIEVSGELIATATIIYERKMIFNGCTYAHVEDVCVKSEYRRHGYGRLIMRKVMEEAVAHGCYKITLDCADSNVAFYEACGLTRRGSQMCELIAHIKAASTEAQ
jgi:glucosamine-phosphate N-acetyltransferase